MIDGVVKRLYMMVGFLVVCVCVLNKSMKTEKIPTLIDILEYTEDQLESFEEKVTYRDLKEVWGEPTLSTDNALIWAVTLDDNTKYVEGRLCDCSHSVLTISTTKYVIITKEVEGQYYGVLMEEGFDNIDNAVFCSIPKEDQFGKEYSYVIGDKLVLEVLNVIEETYPSSIKIPYNIEKLGLVENTILEKLQKKFILE